jgi:hypothetical protein
MAPRFCFGKVSPTTSSSYSSRTSIDDCSLLEATEGFNELEHAIVRERTPERLSAAILDLAMDDRAVEGLRKMSGYGGCDEDVLAAACAKTALEFRSGIEYLRALATHMPAHLNIWVIERMVAVLHRPEFGNGDVLTRNRHLVDHVFDTVEVMQGGRTEMPTDEDFHVMIKRNAGTSDRYPVEFRGLCVDSQAALIEFGVLTHRLLDGVLGTHLVAAGGSVRHLLCSERIGIIKDVDLWVVGCTDEAQCNAVLDTALATLAANAAQIPGMLGQLILTPSVVTVEFEIPSTGVRLPFQIIKRMYATPAQVALSFDMDDAKCVTDGERVWCTKSAHRAMRSGYTVVNPWVITTTARYLKQATKKCMTVVVPVLPRMTRVLIHGRVALMSTQEMVEASKVDNLRGILAAAKVAYRTKRYGESYVNLGGGTGYVQPQRTAALWDPRDGLKSFLATAAPGFEKRMHSEWMTTDPAARMHAFDASNFLSV